MAEQGIDISKNKTKSVFDILKAGGIYQFLITVCDEANAEKCPVFPGSTQRIHWSFKDPSKFTGSRAGKFVQVREVRDAIKDKINEWIAGAGFC